MTAAAATADVSRQTVHTWRGEDPVFANAEESARTAIRDEVRATIKTRAIRGRRVAVRNRHGEVIDHEYVPSDRLLLAIAKAVDPSHFSDRAQPIEEKTDEAWRAALRSIFADPEATAEFNRLADRTS